MEWWYNCLISRIPIFLLGINIGNIHSVNRKYLLSTVLIGLLLYYPCFSYFSKYYAASFLAIPFILVANALAPLLSPQTKCFIEYLGRNSLEIYLANVLILYVFLAINPPNQYKPLLYIILQFLFSYLFIFLSNRLRAKY